MFEDAGDYEAFERVLAEAAEGFPEMRLCAYCLMPNHFHLVLWPAEDGQLSRFMQWVTMADWPVAMPRNWSKLLNQPQDEKELAALRCCRQRGRPYGEAGWVMTTAHRLGIENTLRNPGRPKKKDESNENSF